MLLSWAETISAGFQVRQKYRLPGYHSVSQRPNPLVSDIKRTYITNKSIIINFILHTIPSTDNPSNKQCNPDANLISIISLIKS